MLVRDSDLTAAARVRNAALELFASDGLAATSIRDVADAAGVSPGLVQHHFRTKAGLRDAVNEYVGSTVIGAFGEVSIEGADDPLGALGDQITRVVREHPTALVYVARALAEGDEAAQQLFSAFVDVAKAQLRELDKRGLLRDEADLEWAALYPVVWTLGTVLFEQAITKELSHGLFSEVGLERWNAASTALARHGVTRARRPSNPKR